MALDDSTWVIHSLPDQRGAPSPAAPDTAAHAFRSVLSPWPHEQPARRRGGNELPDAVAARALAR